MSSPKSNPPSHSQGYTVHTGFPVNHREEHHHHHHYHLPQPTNSNTWSSDICHCCEDPCSCCMTFFFPCVTFGRIAAFAEEGSSSCVAKGALYCLATALTAFLGGTCFCGCWNRRRLRKRLGWNRSACDDCCIHCCCHCCALCQEYRHLQSLGYDPAKGWGGNRQMPSGAMGITQPPMMNNMSQQSGVAEVVPQTSER